MSNYDLYLAATKNESAPFVNDRDLALSTPCGHFIISCINAYVRQHDNGESRLISIGEFAIGDAIDEKSVRLFESKDGIEFIDMHHDYGHRDANGEGLPMLAGINIKDMGWMMVTRRPIIINNVTQYLVSVPPSPMSAKSSPPSTSTKGHPPSTSAKSHSITENIINIIPLCVIKAGITANAELKPISDVDCITFYPADFPASSPIIIQRRALLIHGLVGYARICSRCDVASREADPGVDYDVRRRIEDDSVWLDIGGIADDVAAAIHLAFDKIITPKTSTFFFEPNASSRVSLPTFEDIMSRMSIPELITYHKVVNEIKEKGR